MGHFILLRLIQLVGGVVSPQMRLFLLMHVVDLLGFFPELHLYLGRVLLPTASNVHGELGDDVVALGRLVTGRGVVLEFLLPLHLRKELLPLRMCHLMVVKSALPIMLPPQQTQGRLLLGHARHIHGSLLILLSKRFETGTLIPPVGRYGS